MEVVKTNTVNFVCCDARGATYNVPKTLFIRVAEGLTPFTEGYSSDEDLQVAVQLRGVIPPPTPNLNTTESKQDTVFNVRRIESNVKSEDDLFSAL